jgi:hypothetical protein
MAAPETRASLVALLQQTAADPATLALLSRFASSLLADLARRPETLAQLTQLLRDAITAPGNEQALQVLFATFAAEEKTQRLVADLAKKASMDVLADESVRAAAKDMIQNVTNDVQVQKSSGEAMWNAVKFAIKPSWMGGGHHRHAAKTTTTTDEPSIAAAAAAEAATNLDAPLPPLPDVPPATAPIDINNNNNTSITNNDALPPLPLPVVNAIDQQQQQQRQSQQPEKQQQHAADDATNITTAAAALNDDCFCDPVQPTSSPQQQLQQQQPQESSSPSGVQLPSSSSSSSASSAAAADNNAEAAPSKGLHPHPPASSPPEP